MKKNILGAAVIFFVTLAFLLMLQDITDNASHESQTNHDEVNVLDNETNNEIDIATNDIEEQ